MVGLLIGAMRGVDRFVSAEPNSALSGFLGAQVARLWPISRTYWPGEPGQEDHSIAAQRGVHVRQIFEADTAPQGDGDRLHLQDMCSIRPVRISPGESVFTPMSSRIPDV